MKQKLDQEVKFTEQQFEEWLMKQPPERKFGNDSGKTCIGFCFSTETIDPQLEYFNLFKGPDWFRGLFVNMEWQRISTCGEAQEIWRKFKGLTFP
jgi:hypothetical protein